jgi:hypothetical protein
MGGAMARPQVIIDWEEFDKLLALQATQEELAGWFNCSTDTIERAVKREHKMSFADYSHQKRMPGKISLRRTMWQLAMAGNVPMLIWLSKQHLGFSDKTPFDLSKVSDEALIPELKRRLAEEEAKKKEKSNMFGSPVELLPKS